MDSKLQVPFVCQFIPMRWSYEEMVVAQAKLNPLSKRQDRAQREIDEIVAKHRQESAESKRLDDLKEVLAVLSGLEAKSEQEVDHYLNVIDQVLDGKRPFDRAVFKDANGPVTAEQLYVNQKVSDLISNAEMEQSDYRRGNRPNVFLRRAKSIISGLRSACSCLTSLFLSDQRSDCWAYCIGSGEKLGVRRTCGSCVAPWTAFLVVLAEVGDSEAERRTHIRKR